MISVIITTHKRDPSFISRALESVLRQTYRSLEIIVVDDSPPDYLPRSEVAAAVHEYSVTGDIPIYYYAHENSKGACAARNTGLYHAKGEYIAFLDDDDEWLPTKLDKQMQVMLSSDAALVYCGFIYKNDISSAETVIQTEYFRGDVLDKLLFRNFIGSTSIPLIITECLKAAGGFDEKMQSAQDLDIWIRIAEKYTIDYIAEPLVVYHEHDGGQITSNPQNSINGWERLNHKYASYLNADMKIWHRRHICIAPYYAKIGNKKEALRIWFQCVCRCPEKAHDNLRYLKLILLAKKKDKHS